MYKHSYPVTYSYIHVFIIVLLNVCIDDWKIKSSASIYLFATICWIHVNVYLKTFKLLEKKLVEKKNKSTKNFATPCWRPLGYTI